MSELPASGPDFDETLIHFPGLARARELYIQLFKDNTPLVNLGYTPKQIEYSIIALRLLEGEGKVNTHFKKPTLEFGDPTNPGELVEVSYLENNQGFYLYACRETTDPDISDKYERLIRILAGSTFKVLDSVGTIAKIALFQDTNRINELDYLIPQLYSPSAEALDKGVKKENVLTKAARTFGLATTYRAAWVDERTKLEFAVEVNDSTSIKRGEPLECNIWRRLNPVSDDLGIVVPFGRKPNTSVESVKEILSSAQSKAVSGKLALEGT